jgi:FdhD protein
VRSKRAPDVHDKPASGPTRVVVGRRWRTGVADQAERTVAQEAPVAIVHDGSTTAVLMATPADLEDLATGFTLTEGIADDVAQITSVEVVEGELGIEARVWLAHDAGARLTARRRHIAGPTGCGLCGVDSLAEALRPPRRVEARLAVTAQDLLSGMAAAAEGQALGAATRAVHAAAFWRSGEIVALREDVGRHNALDKLIGALVRAATPTDGVILLTSRVSVEMIQKAAAFGAPIVCAVSAPTALAIETAEAAGVTLAAICRADGFEVFTHPERIDLA